jgi:dTDP-L-rhamnose 4-epimerase
LDDPRYTAGRAAVDAPLCLVTGGAGFIGSHTVDLLLARGYRVRILDNLQPRVHPEGKPAFVPAAAEFIHGDVSDPEALAGALTGVDFVFHLAAYQDYMPDFSHFIHTNTESAALLLELVVADRARYPLRKILFASSQAVSGEGAYLCPVCAGVRRIPSIVEQLEAGRSPAADFPKAALRVPAPRSIDQLKRGEWEVRCPDCGAAMGPVLIDETTISPGTAYGISKYAIELLANRLGRRYGIPTACMRYTYVQGPRNSFYNAYSGVARRFALRILHGMPPVVYEDGRQLRDYINVRDVARANVLAMEDPRADYGVFNVGGGRAVTVLEVAAMMLEAFGSPLAPVVPGEFRLGDTRHTVSDISRLRALGWEPEIPVEQNIAEYAEWIRDHTCKRDYLEEAERVMRENGVLMQVER